MRDTKVSKVAYLHSRRKQVTIMASNNIEYNPEQHDYIVTASRFPLVSPEKLQLRIIAKTYMNQGRCYVGFDINTKTLWRPVKTTEENSCCWGTTIQVLETGMPELKINEVYEFTIIKRNPTDIPYPHHYNDVLVSSQFSEITPSSFPGWNLFDEVVPCSFNTVSSVFCPGIIQEKKYIYEHTLCPSAGIYKCKSTQLQMYIVNNVKRRLKIQDGNVQYDFPVTASYFKYPFGGEDVLVVLGLGRPFAGTFPIMFAPRRCYILVIGIITK